MMLTLHSFFLSLLSFLLPVFCSSLSFLVKLEQLDLGGNDLEVLVGEGWWGGSVGGYRGSTSTFVHVNGFLSEHRNRPSSCM